METAEHEVRLPVDLPPDVHAELRTVADQQGQSLNTLIIQLLREALARRRTVARERTDEADDHRGM